MHTDASHLNCMSFLLLNGFCNQMSSVVRKPAFSACRSAAMPHMLISAFVIRCLYNMSRVVRKPAFCICENKDADKLRGNREADQRLCFRYIDSTIPLVPKYKISSFLPSSVAVQPGLCGTWSETPKTGFLTTRLV